MFSSKYLYSLHNNYWNTTLHIEQITSYYLFIKQFTNINGVGFFFQKFMVKIYLMEISQVSWMNIQTHLSDPTAVPLKLKLFWIEPSILPASLSALSWLRLNGGLPWTLANDREVPSGASRARAAIPTPGISKWTTPEPLGCTDVSELLCRFFALKEWWSCYILVIIPVLYNTSSCNNHLYWP